MNEQHKSRVSPRHYSLDGLWNRACTELEMWSPLLFNHSTRVYYFGSLAGKRQGSKFDPELLYVGAMFHDVGLTRRYSSPSDRFEVDGANAARAFLFNNDGTPLSLPWTLSGISTTAATLDQAMAPHARIVIKSSAAEGDALQIGSAQLTTDGSVSGFIRFRYGPRDQEALVPSEARNASSYILPFDNTNGLQAGVALAGAGGTSANIPVLIRDSAGARIGVGIVAVPGNGHFAFVLSDQFPATANKTGTIEFDTPASSQIQRAWLPVPPVGRLFRHSSLGTAISTETTLFAR